MNKDIIQTFQDIFKSPVAIAGGAVRDNLLGRTPKDYDLFLLGQSWQDWETYKLEFNSKFQGKLSRFPRIVSRIEWHKSEPFLIENIMLDGKEVQIMVTPHATIEELVASFDWNVACFAEDEQHQTYDPNDLGAIIPGGYLRLQKLTYPYSTLRRGYRFSDRYLMRLASEDLYTIIDAINEKRKQDASEQSA